MIMGLDSSRGEPITSGDGVMKVWYEGMSWPVFLSHRVNSDQSVEGRVAADTFNRVWFSSQAFSRHLLVHHSSLIADPSTVIIELGAGCGLVSLCAASAGAKRVVITDLEEALPLLRQNVAENVKSGGVEVQKLHWGELADVLQITEGMHGNLLVLGSDLIWHEKLFDALLATMVHFADLPATNPGILSVEIQLASEMRFMADLPGDFCAKAKERGFEAVATDLDVEGLEEAEQPDSRRSPQANQP